MPHQTGLTAATPLLRPTAHPTTLNSQGTPIGAHRVLLAASALRRGHRIVTHNARAFARIGGIALED